MPQLERLKHAETDANRVRKLNAIVDTLNTLVDTLDALGVGDGVIVASALPVATDTTPGIVTIGTGLTVTDGVVTSP